MWLADHLPHREQHALALVVAGAVLVRLAEVADGDGPVDRAHDLAERDLLGSAGEHVAAAHPPLRAHDPGALEGEEDLLEVGLGQPVRSAMSRTEVGPDCRRGAPGRAAPGWRSHPWSRPSPASQGMVGTARGSADRAAGPCGATDPRGPRWWTRKDTDGEHPLLPSYDGPA
jgi:hypothetical protein